MLEVGAQFLLRMREIGYIRDYETDLSNDEFATLYKLAWNNSVSLDADLGWGGVEKPTTAPYKLTQMHRGLMLALAMRAPVTKLSPNAKPEDLHRARIDVLMSKIQEAGKFDPSYPVDYAIGVAHTLGKRQSDARARFEAANAAGLGPELRTSGYLLRARLGRVD